MSGLDDLDAACDDRTAATKEICWASDGWAHDADAYAQQRDVDCPKCLKLMLDAAGPREDERLLRLDAEEQAFRYARDNTPTCDRGAKAGWRPCGAPMVPTEFHGGNHRAQADERIVCIGCGYGRIGTDAEVKIAHDFERLSAAREEAQRRRRA